MVANDRQVGGEHYKAPGKLEHWDIVAQHELDYFQGCITKYVMRHKYKNGVQDLLKAQHFLEKYIELETERAKKNYTYFHVEGGLEMENCKFYKDGSMSMPEEPGTGATKAYTNQG